MNIDENENLVTYTYDEWDRILYKNVYKTDVPYRSAINANEGNIQVLDEAVKRPKQLLYQDVYTYKEGMKRVAPTIKRIYQPVIEFTATRVGSTITMKGSFMCRSKVLASGFIYVTDPEDLKRIIMQPSNYFKGTNTPNRTYRGSEALGTKIHTQNIGSSLSMRAFVQIETGTLFSKTITL